MKQQIKRPLGKRVRKHIPHYLMLLPLLASLLVFSYLPMVGILYAFTDYSPFRKGFSFVGFANFKTLFASAGFWQAFKNTLQISTIRLVVVTLGSIGLALLLDEIRTVWFKKNHTDDRIHSALYVLGCGCVYFYHVLIAQVRNVEQCDRVAGRYSSIFSGG